MPTDDMRVEEVFATTPIVPNASPSDAEIAVGFVGGEADKTFFNKLWNRYSELIFKNQTTAQAQKLGIKDAVGGADDSLLYKDYYIGQSGSDATARTPVAGNVLRNDGGSETNKYFIGGNNTVVKNTSANIPLYTGCGEDSSLLTFVMQLMFTPNALSSDGDFIGFSLNCSGAYQRTDVHLTYEEATDSLLAEVTGWDVTGAIPTAHAFVATPIAGGTVTNRVITFKASKSSDTGFMLLEIPELGWAVDTGLAMVIGTGTNDHGFTFSPHTFLMNNLTIHNEVLF